MYHYNESSSLSSATKLFVTPLAAYFDVFEEFKILSEKVLYKKYLLILKCFIIMKVPHFLVQQNCL